MSMLSLESLFKCKCITKNSALKKSRLWGTVVYIYTDGESSWNTIVTLLIISFESEGGGSELACEKSSKSRSRALDGPSPTAISDYNKYDMLLSWQMKLADIWLIHHSAKKKNLDSNLFGDFCIPQCDFDRGE